MTVVTIEELASDPRRFIRRAAAGEVIMIQENGKPLAKLTTDDGGIARLLERAQAAGLRVPSQPKQPRDASQLVKSVVQKSAAEMVIEDRR
jgi:antitoxin (DNA-binding transcriptional repressor) of toxin-antitoxin stability system